MSTAASPTSDERDRLRSLVDGDPATWATFVEAHAAMLHAAVARVVRSSADGDAFDADDVLQTVFSKLWEDGRRRLRSFGGRSRLSTWLVAVAQREALERLRARRTVSVGRRSLCAFDAASPDATDAVIAREEGLALDEALARLPARDRLLVRLVHADGRSYADVARLLDVPENSISPWLVRARQRLKALLPAAAASDRTDSRPVAL